MCRNVKTYFSGIDNIKVKHVLKGGQSLCLTIMRITSDISSTFNSLAAPDTISLKKGCVFVWELRVCKGYTRMKK